MSEEKTFVEIESMLGRKFEPKRKCRWIIKVDGLDPFLAKRAQRPQAYVDDGKTAYSPITIELYDPIAPSATQMAWEWLDKKDRRDITLQMLDPVGTIVEEWHIPDASLDAVDFGELDYASAEPATVKLTLTFDKCELKF